MPAPVLIAVEEDAGALRDVERELRGRYSRDYEVICTVSSREAHARLEDLAAAGEDVALVLVSPALSEAAGSDLLEEARHLHPHAKRGLLIPWGVWGESVTGEASQERFTRFVQQRHPELVNRLGPLGRRA